MHHLSQGPVKSTASPRDTYMYTNCICELLAVYAHIQDGLAEIGVEVNNGVAELINVLCQELVGVVDTVVQVIHLIIH